MKDEGVSFQLGDQEEDFEEISKEELDRLEQEALEEIRNQPITWRPQPGQKKMVEVVEQVEKETEFGKTPFYIVRDLRSKQLLSLLAHGILLKNLEVGKWYLLIYEGKKGDYHSWVWRELKRKKK